MMSVMTGVYASMIGIYIKTLMHLHPYKYFLLIIFLHDSHCRLREMKSQ